MYDYNLIWILKIWLFDLLKLFTEINIFFFILVHVRTLFAKIYHYKLYLNKKKTNIFCALNIKSAKCSLRQKKWFFARKFNSSNIHLENINFNNWNKNMQNFQQKTAWYFTKKMTWFLDLCQSIAWWFSAIYSDTFLHYFLELIYTRYHIREYDYHYNAAYHCCSNRTNCCWRRPIIRGTCLFP